MRRMLLLPSAARGTVRTTPVATLRSMSLLLGLVSASWERFGNIAFGPYNVKFPALCLTVCAALCIPLVPELARRVWGSGTARLLVGLIAALTIWLFARSVLAANVSLAAPQMAAMLSGALAPGFGVAACVRSREDLVWVLRWFVRGAYLACIFGLYQLAAFYLHLPQGIPYKGVGTEGYVGRISAANYEPAYFAYFLILALGARLTVAALLTKPVPILEIIGFAIVLELANVRALIFLLPLLVLMLILRARLPRRTAWAMAISLVAVVVLNLTIPTVVSQAVTAARATHPPSPTSLPSEATAPAPPASSSPPRPSPAGSTAAPEPPTAPPPAAVLDPNEASSNAPRLHGYSEVLSVIRSHPIAGVGLGNLGVAMGRAQTPSGPRGAARTVANNVWLQALADGGPLAALCELAISLMLLVALLRGRDRSIAPLLAAWLCVLGVGGMLTSYFFNLGIFVVLGMIVAGMCIDLDGAVETAA